jgi:hypothetical protein
MIRINLVREETVIAAPSPQRRSLLVAAGTIAVLLTVHLMQGRTVASLEERRARLADEVEILRTTATETRDASRRAEPLPRGAESAAGRLRALARAAPPDLWVVLYRRRGAEVVIKGRTLDDAAVESFADRLSNTAGFGGVEIRETSLRSAEGESSAAILAAEVYEFTIAADLGSRNDGAGDRPRSDG